MNGGGDVGGLEAEEVLGHVGGDWRSFLEDLWEVGVHRHDLIPDGRLGDAALVAEDVVQEGAPPGTRTAVTEVRHDMLEDSVEVCNEVPAAEPAGGLNLNIGATGRGTDDERRGGGVGDGREAGVVE